MHQDNSLLTIIIPAYNEVDSLRNVLEELIPFCKVRGWEIIVVNDGSKDGTKELLSAFATTENLKILHHKVNKGYGGAIKTGIKSVTTKYCVTIDADGQHDLQDVESMFQKMIETDADLII